MPENLLKAHLEARLEVGGLRLSVKFSPDLILSFHLQPGNGLKGEGDHVRDGECQEAAGGGGHRRRRLRFPARDRQPENRPARVPGK